MKGVNPLQINEIVQKYENMRSILDKIEAGNWRDDEKVRELSLEKIEQIRDLTHLLEDGGIGVLAKMWKAKN